MQRDQFNEISYCLSRKNITQFWAKFMGLLLLTGIMSCNELEPNETPHSVANSKAMAGGGECGGQSVINALPVDRTICVPGMDEIVLEQPSVMTECFDAATLEVKPYIYMIKGWYAGNQPIENNTVMLPEGQSTIKWIASDALGNSSYANQQIVVTHATNESCCEAGQSIYDGSEMADFIYEGGSPRCILAKGGADYVSLYGTAADYVSLGSGGGNDFFHGRPGGGIVVGDGDDDAVYFSCDSSAYGG